MLQLALFPTKDLDKVKTWTVRFPTVLFSSTVSRPRGLPFSSYYMTDCDWLCGSGVTRTLPPSPRAYPRGFDFVLFGSGLYYSPPPGAKKETIPHPGTPIYLKYDSMCNSGGNGGFCAIVKTYVFSRRTLRRAARDNHVKIPTLSNQHGCSHSVVVITRDR